MDVDIEVTQEMIDKGQSPGGHFRVSTCPMFLAVKSRFPNCVTLSRFAAMFYNKEHTRPQEFLLPVKLSEEMSEFVGIADRHYLYIRNNKIKEPPKPQPSTFKWSVPDEL
jgi:hypothetical protein